MATLLIIQQDFCGDRIKQVEFYNERIEEASDKRG